MASIMKPVGVSLTSDLLKRIDSDRGLVGRSLFLREIIEEHYSDEKGKRKKDGRTAEGGDSSGRGSDSNKHPRRRQGKSQPETRLLNRRNDTDPLHQQRSVS